MTVVGRFASKPKKGIKFLQDNTIVGSVPQDVAKWLYSEKRINQVMTTSICSTLGN